MPKVVDREESTESQGVLKNSEASSASIAAWYSLVESETEDMLNERFKRPQSRH